MLSGKGGVERSAFVREAVRLIAEQALEAEVTEELGALTAVGAQPPKAVSQRLSLPSLPVQPAKNADFDHRGAISITGFRNEHPPRAAQGPPINRGLLL